MKPINIDGFEHYLIDESGNVYNSLGTRCRLRLNPKKLKQWPNKNVGYMQIVLQNSRAGLKPKCFYVHRLVALTYIPNPNNLPEVNHIVPDKTLNNLWNLEWVTASENQYYRVKHGNKPKTKTNNQLLLENRVLIEEGINHFNQYSDVKALREFWDCSNVMINKIFKLHGLPKLKDRVFKKLTPDMVFIVKNEIQNYLNTTKLSSKKENINKFINYMYTNFKIKMSYHIFCKLKKGIKKIKV
jgi:hypothetical protein